MDKELNIIMALKDGKPVHVKDVERGLKCGCKCAACGEDLIARQGKIMSWHFAHKSGGNCAYGLESSLHLLAKDILLKTKSIRVPAVKIMFGSKKDAIVLLPEQDVKIASVELERRRGDVIPDVVIKTADGWEMFVEIAVTHFIDDEKLVKLRNIGVPTLEIALNRDDDAPDISDILFGNCDDFPTKYWAYHPLPEAGYKTFMDNAETLSCEDLLGTDETMVVGCPMVKHAWAGKAYADVFAECDECEYCIRCGTERVFCTGMAMMSDITSMSDHKRRNPEWVRSEITRRSKNALEDAARHVCPLCGNKMHYDTSGHTVECEHCGAVVAPDDIREAGEAIGDTSFVEKEAETRRRKKEWLDKKMDEEEARRKAQRRYTTTVVKSSSRLFSGRGGMKIGLTSHSEQCVSSGKCPRCDGRLVWREVNGGLMYACDHDCGFALSKGQMLARHNG